MKEDFLDDRVIIPDDIKKMTVEELEAAIKELEQELKEKFPGVFIEKNDFGPVLSHHLGRGLLALSWIEK